MMLYKYIDIGRSIYAHFPKEKTLVVTAAPNNIQLACQQGMLHLMGLKSENNLTCLN